MQRLGIREACKQARASLRHPAWAVVPFSSESPPNIQSLGSSSTVIVTGTGRFGVEQSRPETSAPPRPPLFRRSRVKKMVTTAGILDREAYGLQNRFTTVELNTA